MPSKTIACEFCPRSFRKDRYGIHMKAKHVQQLARQFLEDVDEKMLLSNPIRSIAKGKMSRHIPVYSKRDEQACFFFGRVPRYFEDEDNYHDYIHDEENMILHRQHVMQIIAAIPLSEYLQRVQYIDQHDMEEMQHRHDCKVEHLQSTIDTLRQKLETGGKVLRFETLQTLKHPPA